MAKLCPWKQLVLVGLSNFLVVKRIVCVSTCDSMISRADLGKSLVCKDTKMFYTRR